MKIQIILKDSEYSGPCRSGGITSVKARENGISIYQNATEKAQGVIFLPEEDLVYYLEKIKEKGKDQ